MDAHISLQTRTTKWPCSTKGQGGSNHLRVRRGELQTAWVALLRGVPWRHFVTLTFDPKRRFPINSKLATRDALTWCGYLGWAFRRPVAWLIAPERGRSGQWHSHVLIAGAPSDLSCVASIWQQRNGHFHSRTIDNQTRAVLYSTKEAALSGEILFSDTVGLYKGRRSDHGSIQLCPGIDS